MRGTLIASTGSGYEQIGALWFNNFTVGRMERERTNGALERGAAADLWRHTLSQIPSVYGRLVFLASLRDPNTGKYEHHGLALVFGDPEADKALRKSHTEAFDAWLNFTVEQQKADLDLYISSLGSRKSLIETWTRLAPFRNLVPSAIRETDRQLFFADLEASLALLRNVYGVSSPDPSA